MGPPVRALEPGQPFNHCGLRPQRRRMRPVAFGPKRTFGKTRTIPRLAARKARGWTSLQSDWHLHLRALTSAKQAGRLNVSWPGGAGRWWHEAILRAGHDIAYAPCRLAREWSFLCRRKG